MSKAAGSLPDGRRRRDEVPPIPDPADLDDLERRAQEALKSLVDEAGGRFNRTGAIRIDHLGLLSLLFDAWARRQASTTDLGVYFSGRPGLWKALDRLYPLQDPNRWDGLRAAVIEWLEQGSWRRSPPRGSGFDLLD